MKQRPIPIKVRYATLILSISLIFLCFYSPALFAHPPTLTSKPLTEKARALTAKAVDSIALNDDYQAAIRYYEAALKEMPNDRGILIALSHAKYEQQKKLGLIEPKPNAKAAILLNALQEGRGDWRASLRYLEQALLVEKDKDRLLAIRDALVELKGVYDDQEFQKDLMRMIGGFSRQDSTVYLLKDAFRNLQAGDYEEAIYCFNGALKLNPGDIRIREMIAYARGVEFNHYEGLRIWAQNQNELNEKLKAEALLQEQNAKRALTQAQNALRLSQKYEDREAATISQRAIKVAKQALAKARGMLARVRARLAAIAKAQAAAARGKIGLASRLKGDVRIKSGPGWTALGRNTALKSGDVIRTGKNGFGEFVMTDGSILSLAANTEVTIGGPGGKYPAYQIAMGQIHSWINCFRLFNKPCRQLCYRVSNANVCARGTRLEIDARKTGAATITVMDGSVEIGPDSRGGFRKISAGHKVVIGKNGLLGAKTRFKAGAITPWWE